jgi:indoleamine 2,3-dioxygenase
VDTAFGVEYPRNALTEYLYQMRAYRPLNHQAYINWCGSENKATNFSKYCQEDNYSALLVLRNIHSTFRFRHQHWIMTKQYIINNTKYPRATGGTPITTWLPN